MVGKSYFTQQKVSQKVCTRQEPQTNKDYRMTFGVRMYLPHQPLTPNKFQNQLGIHLMGTPKTSILLPAKRYPVVQANSDSKGSSTSGLTYSPNVCITSEKYTFPQPQRPAFHPIVLEHTSWTPSFGIQQKNTADHQYSYVDHASSRTSFTWLWVVPHNVNLAVKVAHRPGIQIIIWTNNHDIYLFDFVFVYQLTD